MYTKGPRLQLRGKQMLYKLFRREEAEAVEKFPATPLRFGVPQPCPQCGRGTTLGRIDVRHRVQYQNCRRCDQTFALEESHFAKAS